MFKNIFYHFKHTESVDLDLKIIHNIVYTKEKLFTVGIINDSCCSLCEESNENILHLLIFCKYNNDLNNLIRCMHIDFHPEGFSFVQLMQWLLFGFSKLKSTHDKNF